MFSWNIVMYNRKSHAKITQEDSDRKGNWRGGDLENESNIFVNTTTSFNTCGYRYNSNISIYGAFCVLRWCCHIAVSSELRSLTLKLCFQSSVFFSSFQEQSIAYRFTKNWRAHNTFIYLLTMNTLRVAAHMLIFG